MPDDTPIAISTAQNLSVSLKNRLFTRGEARVVFAGVTCILIPENAFQQRLDEAYAEGLQIGDWRNE